MQDNFHFARRRWVLMYMYILCFAAETKFSTHAGRASRQHSPTMCLLLYMVFSGLGYVIHTRIRLYQPHSYIILKSPELVAARRRRMQFFYATARVQI